LTCQARKDILAEWGWSPGGDDPDLEPDPDPEPCIFCIGCVMSASASASAMAMAREVSTVYLSWYQSQGGMFWTFAFAFA
jgi:hypothetical protein